VKLRTEFDPTLIAVHADADQIWEAVLNLVSKQPRSDARGVSSSSAPTRRQAGTFACHDTGTGINPEQLALSVPPFFTTKTAGTGLGLALVQQIAVENAVILNVTVSRAGQAPLRFSCRSRRDPDMPIEPTILLVDDDERLRRAAGKVLAAAGYRVVNASSAGGAGGIAGTSVGVGDLRPPPAGCRWQSRFSNKRASSGLTSRS